LLKNFLNIKKYNIHIESVNDDGDVVFSTLQKDMGISDEDVKNSTIIKSNFFANFVGEFLVRANFNKFLKIMLKTNPNEYRKLVCGFNHKNFGMLIGAKNKFFKFQFHISLIQSILTEDLNNIVSSK